MKATTLILLGLILLSMCTFSGCQETYTSEDGRINLANQETLYYGIKINDVVCGYSIINIELVHKDGQNLLQFSDSSFIMLAALGSQFNNRIKSVIYSDPVTGQFVSQENHIAQGPMEFTANAYVQNDTVIVNSTLSPSTDRVPITPDVILSNGHFFPRLISDFAGEKKDMSYSAFEIRDCKVQQTNFTRMDDETLKLAGGSFEALVLEEMNQETGVKIKWWVDKNSGYLLKSKTPRGETFLAKADIVKQIAKSSMDDLILSKANVTIADYQGISYMKVKARLEPSGLRATTESLNVPGQKFTGTVTDNLIEGVFEIQHPRYNGTNAPSFPPDFGSIEAVQEFLKADDFVESADPVLVEKAKQLTLGAKDSWEAAVRLSQWVADSIGYAIPGGGTARRTYDIRKGECGAHSILLAAFSRAVGIPARMVWGCMYVPNRRGSFGQHGWTEIYMGDAGWIPVDATAREVDYVDSGHLRVGHFQSTSIALNPKEFEILDYRVGDSDKELIEEKYADYVGKYKGALTLNVQVQDGCLSVDIPGKVVLALHDADVNGCWYAKATHALFFEFLRDENEIINKLILHEIVSMPKKSEADSAMLKKAPKDVAPYLGVYDFQQVNAEFSVSYKEGSLTVYNSLEKRDVKLQQPDENGRWKDEFNKNDFMFEKTANGSVKALVIDSNNTFEKEL